MENLWQNGSLKHIIHLNLVGYGEKQYLIDKKLYTIIISK